MEEEFDWGALTVAKRIYYKINNLLPPYVNMQEDF